MPAAGAIAISAGLAFAACAQAQAMPKEQYASAKDAIAAAYKSAMTDCGSLSGNARDVCKADAGGKQKIARAELEAEYKPTDDAVYKVRLARADATYSLAREKCDDAAGNVKDVCVKEAKADAVAAKSDAKSRLAAAKADVKAAGAQRDAASATRDADYAVAKEKCEAFAGDAKSNCMTDAKVRFGKS